MDLLLLDSDPLLPFEGDGLEDELLEVERLGDDWLEELDDCEVELALGWPLLELLGGGGGGSCSLC